MINVRDLAHAAELIQKHPHDSEECLSGMVWIMTRGPQPLRDRIVRQFEEMFGPLPVPSHVDESGQYFYDAETAARFVGRPVEEVAEMADRLGIGVHGRKGLRRVQ